MTTTRTLISAFAISSLLFSCQKTVDITENRLSRSVASAQVADCGLLRTQTPGGWGSKPSGNNPGAYLHANFNTTFGGELIVGCYGTNYVRLTSAQAITNLLPTGGKAAVLSGAYTNPVGMKNVLVGHLVALKLSVTFDMSDAGFGQSSGLLYNRLITSGAFKGWEVGAFLAEADNVIGGCSSEFTPEQVLETAAAINENFVDGKIDKGYLICPADDGVIIPD